MERLASRGLTLSRIRPENIPFFYPFQTQRGKRKKATKSKLPNLQMQTLQIEGQVPLERRDYVNL